MFRLSGHKAIAETRMLDEYAIYCGILRVLIDGGSGSRYRLAVTVLLLSWTAFILDVNSKPNKKLSYHRGTARCVVSIEILPIATQ